MYAPTILTAVPQPPPITREETFGPVLVIEAVDDAEDALAKATDTRYGLCASILTSDQDRGLDLAQRFDCGMVHINGPTMASEPSLPNGGVKESGWGRSGPYAVEDFTEIRLIDADPRARSLPDLSQCSSRHPPAGHGATSWKEPAMRIVALEEHCTFPDLAARIRPEAIVARGLTPGGHQPPVVARRDQLQEVGADRLADMDDAGITLQVLSVAQAGADLLPGEEGAGLAHAINDRLAQTVAAHPDRYAAFTHLPTSAPELAADELERCVTQHKFLGGMVNGTTGGLFLDDPKFEPLLARFERLGVPLYLHPAPPPPAVRDVYYDRLPGHSSLLLSIAGWGWHSETAIHVLRLVLSGALDRHPGLKLVIGHMGEGLPAMFARCDQVFADEARDRLTAPSARRSPTRSG